MNTRMRASAGRRGQVERSESMKLEYKLKLLHDIVNGLPATEDRSEKEGVLVEAAQALIYVHSEDVERRFLKAMNDAKKPLTPIQKLMVGMCLAANGTDDREMSK